MRYMQRDRAPRTLNEAFGPYARLTIRKERSNFRDAMEGLGYALAGWLIGVVIAGVLYGAYRALFRAVM